MPKMPKRPGTLYHTTSYAAIAAIREHGLDPARGGQLFKAYRGHAKGRTFLAEADSALGWFAKVEDMLEYHAGDDAAPEDVVPVMLMVSIPKGTKLQEDDVGSSDVLGGSWFVTTKIGPEFLAYWDPIDGEWMALADWNDPSAELGVSSVEFYDEDGDPTDDEDAATSRALQIFGAYDDGGFKPSHNDPGWEDDWEA